MRPRLLADVRFVRSGDGVFIRGDQSECTITGEHSFDWLAKLAPYLNGRHTLDELTEALSADRSDLVRRLVGQLAAQRFVMDERAVESHELSDQEQAIYAPEIAYIGYAFDSAEHRFERVRRARIAVVSTGTAGPVVAALIEAGLGSGWRDVRVAGYPEPGLSAAVEAGRRDDAQRVRECGEVPGDCDVVLQVHQGADRGELLRVGGRCEAAGQALGQVWVRPDEAWLAGVSAKPSSSCWWRVTGPRDAGPGPEPGECWMTGAVPAVVAAQAALSCFEHLTGLAAPAEEQVLTRIDLRTLDTRRHRVRPWRLTVGPAASGDAAGELTASALLDRAASYLGSRTGVLGKLDEGSLSQSPQRVCQATISDPLGLLPSWAPSPVVMGWGQDARSARLRALLAGLATYQALLEEEKPSVPYQAPAGVGAGLSWPAAVAAGLAQQCERLLDAAAPDGSPAAVLLDDPGVARLAGLLDAAGETIKLRDLTSVLGIPAYATADMSPACGTTPAVAMSRLLERALLAWQAATTGQPGYAGQPGPMARWADCYLPQDGPGSAVEMFTRALTDAGRPPAISVLGRDTEVAELLPFVARVTCGE